MASVIPTRSSRSRASVARRWFLVAFGILILTVLAGVYNAELVLPKTYRAETQLKVFSSTSPVDPALGIRPMDSVEFQTEYERILSPAVLEPVISELGLNKIWAQRYYKSAVDKLPMENALKYLNSILRVTLVHGTNLVVISALSEKSEEAADIANSVAAHYQALRDDEMAKRNERGIEILRTQIDDQQKLLDGRKAAYQQLLDKTQSLESTPTTPTTTSGPTTDELKNAEHDVQKAQALLDALNLRLKEIISSSRLLESPVKIINTADVPNYPAGPNLALNLVFSIIEGGLIGVAVATLLEVYLWWASRPARRDGVTRPSY